ncbi:epoxide hydrolase family protein [Streptomyces sp. 351MFTsu5.1]|uniref:epoxide hydrolase family protein n=1 Tax=Streptomyces sp. 351MFTsu5.1 TaxID=1172180 RepID=UPI0005BBDA49|nr:epoxide hydrolase family protein [Streptomyces sp. 351MFTsu5.1]
MRPFTIDVPQADLDDLRQRLLQSRLFDSDLPPAAGVPTGYLRELVSYWAEKFDWRAAERQLNELPQFQADVTTDHGDFSLHFVHARGKGPHPMPLLFTHGWPGSFWEVHKILGPLTDPAAHGGDPADAFDVVAPSLPGYGFSPHPGRPGVDPGAIADAFHALMTRTLDYPRYVAQGGDWGSLVTTALARDHGGSNEQGVAAIHLNMFAGPYLPSGEPSPAEQSYLGKQRAWQAAEGGYGHIQGTKPLTLGHALADSPAGLAAWIVEKFQTWSDCDGDVERVFSKDDLLTHIMLYWLGGTISTSFRLYHELDPGQPLGNEPIATPTAFAAFAHEFSTAPREVVARAFDLERYTEFDSGGHFAALEKPVELVEDIRAAFRPHRR